MRHRSENLKAIRQLEGKTGGREVTGWQERLENTQEIWNKELEHVEWAEVDFFCCFSLSFSAQLKFPSWKRWVPESGAAPPFTPAGLSEACRWFHPGLAHSVYWLSLGPSPPSLLTYARCHSRWARCWWTLVVSGVPRWTLLQAVLTVQMAEGGEEPEHLKPACRGLFFTSCLSPLITYHTMRGRSILHEYLEWGFYHLYLSNLRCYLNIWGYRELREDLRIERLFRANSCAR